MKKTLLSLILAMLSAIPVCAQQNLLVNGDFEDVANTVFATFQLNDDEKATYAKTIPGWDKGNDKDAVEATNGFNGLSVWNVYANILEQEEDGDKIVEGNTHHLRLQRYDYNGWATGVLKQTVNGLTVGTTYRLSLLYRFSLGDYNGDVPQAGVEVVALSGGKESNIVLHRDFEDNSDWVSLKADFKATTTSVVVKLFLTNPWREKQWNDNVWADFDEIALGQSDGSPIDPGDNPDDPAVDSTGIKQYPGYKLVFHDEFDQDGKPNSNYWKTETGFLRNHEDQYYQADNAWVEGGNLVIEAREEAVKNARYRAGSSDWRYQKEYSTYTSASVVSRGRKTGDYVSAWKYGRFEVRAKLPCYTGCWPAIWCLGTDYEWPFNGEIDIMEYYPVGGEESLHANVAWGSTTHWMASWQSAVKKVADLVSADPNWRNEYHTWRMDWDSLNIRLYVDDLLLNNCNLNRTVNPRTNWFQHDDVNPYRGHYQYLLLNLALGGDNGGSLDNTPLPVRYLVDYVRIYQKTDNTDGISNVYGNKAGDVQIIGGHGRITLVSSADASLHANVTVYNVSGCKSYCGQVRLGSSKSVTLPVGFAKGLYLVKVMGSGIEKTEKVVVND